VKRGPLPPECPISAARNCGISLSDWPGRRQGVIGMGRAVPTVAYGLDRRPMEHVRAGAVGVPADPVGSFVRLVVTSKTGQTYDRCVLTHGRFVLTTGVYSLTEGLYSRQVCTHDGIDPSSSLV